MHLPRADDACGLRRGALASRSCPIVATHHAHGDLGWMGPALHFWGFLMDRIDARIAVSPMAAESAARWLPGDYRVIPNGVLIPDDADPADRDDTVVFIGRHDQRKGLPTLLRAWPAIHAATGMRLRVIGTDPLQYRLLHSRLRFDEVGHRRARHRPERGAHARARARQAAP